MPKGLYCFAWVKRKRTISEKLRDKPLLCVVSPNHEDPEATGYFLPSGVKIHE